MTSAGIERIRACFEKAEEIFPIVYPENRHGAQLGFSRGSLPQLPQLPQPKASACRVLTDREDEFEERAAIIECDGGLPRPLAEFLAGRGRG
ncbi:hypothetical protein C1J03_06965 [Sulfitobacter sp. SK012]|nr:hypothetical protein C1J03_06965 [Sulfitobacter sp. SK012]